MFLYKVGSLGSLPLMLLNPFGRNPIRDAPRTQCPGSFSGDVRPCTTSSAQRPGALCPSGRGTFETDTGPYRAASDKSSWSTLGAAGRDVWKCLGPVLPIPDRSTQDEAACCSCKEEGRDPSRASSCPHGPLLYQAPSPPLVLKGISHLQHSLSLSSKICCPQHKSEVTPRPWSSALTEGVLAASVAGNCTCWGGSSHLGPHPRCFPVLTPLPRLQCDHGMSLQALARTLCCQSEGLGLPTEHKCGCRPEFP